MIPAFQHPCVTTLQARLSEPARRMIVVAGPRQVGKSTLVRQALQSRDHAFLSADMSDQGGTEASAYHAIMRPAPTLEWLARQWEVARTKARVKPPGQNYVLVIDHIQKIQGWQPLVKALWSQDRAEQLPLHVVVIATSPGLVQKKLSAQLSGQYEWLPVTHWSYPHMQEAFDFSLEEYLYFGGYPGGAERFHEEEQWRQYIRSFVVSPSLQEDILQITRVDKPALLKALFELGCGYSGQVISYTRLQSQLDNAGNTVTLSHYLDILEQVGLLSGLQKYRGNAIQQRASVPKLNAHNPALAATLGNYSFTAARNDRSYWHFLIETSVGAHLLASKSGRSELYYWRESPNAVDFVLSNGHRLLAIVIMGWGKVASLRGLEVFRQQYPGTIPMIIGEGGMPLQEFLSQPATTWLE